MPAYTHPVLHRSVCGHCNSPIVSGPRPSLWLTDESNPEAKGFEQYCWMDEVHGSQLHQPLTITTEVLKNEQE